MTVFALHNGKPASSLSFLDRGFAYGDGLFETIGVIEGRAQFLAEHLRRLYRDCFRLNILLDARSLEAEIAALLARCDEGILKIVVTRAGTQRGYAVQKDARGERFLLFYPQKFTADARSREGVAVRVCRQRLSEQRSLAGMKHLHRLEQVLARAEWSDSTIAEGLMLDSSGRLIEGTMSNIYIVDNGRVLTPRLHRCGVAGVIREIVMMQLASHCAPVIETDLTLDDIYTAEEVFLSNSVIGIWPVRKIECLSKPIGGVTIAFQTALFELSLHHSER